MLVQGAGIRTIQIRLGDNDEKTKWSTTIGCRKDRLGYEAPTTYLEEQRDVMQTA